MQPPVAAILCLSKLENNIPKINAVPHRFIHRRPRQRLRYTKQRIITLDRRKKGLNRKTSRRVTRNYAGSCGPLRHLSKHFDPHACENTRGECTLQVQTLARAETSPPRPLHSTNSGDTPTLLESRLPDPSNTEPPMNEPTPSRPYWPDFADMPKDPSKGLKPWSWALQRLEKSHNYWIATARPDGRAHLMLVWGVWWEDAFWFSTGPQTRKAKNIAALAYCSIGTEQADEAVILEGVPHEITDRAIWKRLAAVYNKKYGGDVEPMLITCGGNVYRVEPETAFGQDEHATNFAESATRWRFSQRR
jgi:hypothetical protein